MPSYKKLVTLLVAFAAVFSTADAIIYIHSNVGEPWGRTDNLTAMNNVFGAPNVQTALFETVNVGATFSASTDFIFMTGGDDNTNELYSFMATNGAAIESWVSSGGALFITAAPNEGTGGSIGFGSSIDGSGLGNGIVTDASHPIFAGTGLSNSSLVSGTSFHHDALTGLAGFTTLMTGSSSGNPILATRPWGAGRVTLGTLTANFFVTAANWDQPASQLILENTLDYTATAVPEPSTTGLIGGLAALGAVVLRRRRL